MHSIAPQRCEKQPPCAVNIVHTFDILFDDELNMSHPFGDLLTQYLHRKHGLSQSKLAAGILQSPSIISDMSQGKRLYGPQARERVTAIIAWLQQQDAL